VNRSIGTIKADLAQSQFGATGRDIVWAVIGSGVDAQHPHFKRYGNCDLPAPLHHIDYSKADFSKISWGSPKYLPKGLLDKSFLVNRPSDTSGHGTGVAGIIAGENDSPWNDQLMKGMAPETKILSVNVLNKKSLHDTEKNVLAALQAIQHINESRPLIHGVIVPLSLRWDARNYACGHSPVCAEVDRTVNSGVVVVTASGNSSYDQKRDAVVEGGIADPGNAELAITVGATHRTIPQIYGPSFFSCRGPTADGRRKPDILAPGERLTVCRYTFPLPRRKTKRATSEEDKYRHEPATSKEEHYGYRDGTQYAAAHVAGAIAGLLSVRRELIGKPREVKQLLLRTALSLGREEMYQGSGLLDAFAAIREASGHAAPTSPAIRPLNIFCSYSHKDAALWQEFKAHLAPMERAGRIKVWSDGLIEPGKRWEAEIYRALDAADIVLLLVSAYFVESDFCYSKELQRAVEREAQGHVTIVPVRVRPVILKGTVLSEIQALPSEAKPITSFGDPHEGWTQVTERLFDLVERMRSERAHG
jgi:subtilisin family serine protease